MPLLLLPLRLLPLPLLPRHCRLSAGLPQVQQSSQQERQKIRTDVSQLPKGLHPTVLVRAYGRTNSQHKGQL